MQVTVVLSGEASLQLTLGQVVALVRRDPDGQVTLHFWLLPCCCGKQAIYRHLLTTADMQKVIVRNKASCVVMQHRC